MAEPITPRTLNLKRKAQDAPPTTLILEKRINSGTFIYRRREIIGGPASTPNGGAQSNPSSVSLGAHGAASTTSSPVRSTPKPAPKPIERRIFHLNRPSTSESDKKKRKTRHEAVFTFSESSASQDAFTEELKDDMDIDPLQLKRPGKNAAISAQRVQSVNPNNQPTMRQQAALGVMADELHELALEELARQSKPKTTPVPKISGAKSKELHRQRASHDTNRMMPGEEYVFDTYELVPAGELQSTGLAPDRDHGNVGYLIISEEDEQLWERFQEDELSDKDWDTDDEDENAEGFYGADYPEEELASDDEYDRDMYKKGRRDGSDDEEWDEDTGSYSDDEYERTMNPWKAKTPGQFAKFADAKDGFE